MWHCHCVLCRKLSGSVFATRVEAMASDFRWLRGQGRSRAFCGQCGSPTPRPSRGGNRVILPAGGLPVVTPQAKGIGVPVGSLDTDPGARVRFHIFCGGKAPWFDITDDLPQFDEYPPAGFDWRQGVGQNRGR
jgi:hypothetical protein